MGGLIPIGGGADAEIKGLLNTAFNDTNIKILRGIVAKEDLFDNHHHLHRVAYRLGTYPVKTYTGDDAKGKWFYFLKTILKGAVYNNNSTTDSIKAILSYAMRNTGVKRVVFDAVQGTDNPPADHYVYPNNPVIVGDIAALVDATGTLNISLICPSPLPNKSAPVPNQQADLDESPTNIIEKRPIKIFTPSILAPPVLLIETRKPRGKTKKKRAPQKTTKSKKKRSRK
jgi:hypothetical protein